MPEEDKKEIDIEKEETPVEIKKESPKPQAPSPFRVSKGFEINGVKLGIPIERK